MAFLNLSQTKKAPKAKKVVNANKPKTTTPINLLESKPVETTPQTSVVMEAIV
ncbi:hypothetical protein PI124_g14691 [Phytophthora idaei]|nr:hypothetical protein PI125_g14445 [Phytophthora idaei]KAG3141008.1 hypothetical protein PI126_g15699 [Phytophthora idaei]KAG3240421.1 hypothetical protein PI124_g14691 [Phytophthora idaei]